MSILINDFVYMLRLGNVYKIGRTNNPKKRMASLQLPQKPQGTWHRVPDSRAAERELHDRFKAQRTYGEWFLLEPHHVQEAEEILARHMLKLFDD